MAIGDKAHPASLQTAIRTLAHAPSRIAGSVTRLVNAPVRAVTKLNGFVGAQVREVNRLLGDEWRGTGRNPALPQPAPLPTRPTSRATPTRVQRLAGESEQLRREEQQGILGRVGYTGSVTDGPARLLRWAGQGLTEGAAVLSRTVAPVLHNRAGDGLTQGLQALGNVSAEDRRAEQAGERWAAYFQAQRDAKVFGPRGLEKVQETRQRQAEAENRKALQGADILGPRGMTRERAVAEQAAQARMEAQPERSWAQKLAGTVGQLPGAFMFDQQTESIGTQALRRNPNAPAGALLLDALATPNPLALLPGGPLARLAQLGPVGNVARGTANLLGAGAGLGTEIPVQLTRLAAQAGLKALQPVGQAAQKLAQGEGQLARVAARLADDVTATPRMPVRISPPNPTATRVLRATGEGAFFPEDTLPYQPTGLVEGQLQAGSCVAASGRMLLNDPTVPEAFIRNLAGVDSDGGLLANLPAALEQLGTPGYQFRKGLSVEGLKTAVTSGPAAVTVSTATTDGLHALVVDAVEDGLVHIRDPLPEGRGSAYKLGLEAFEKAWNGKAVIKE